jgi:hypothetical protein
VLFHDHGRVLKRVFREPGAIQGIAQLTRLTLADVLKTWQWVYEKTGDRRDDDTDAAEVYKEIAEQIDALWDRGADDLMMQGDRVVDLLAEHLLVKISRTTREKT